MSIGSLPLPSLCAHCVMLSLHLLPIFSVWSSGFGNALECETSYHSVVIDAKPLKTLDLELDFRNDRSIISEGN